MWHAPYYSTELMEPLELSEAEPSLKCAVEASGREAVQAVQRTVEVARERQERLAASKRNLQTCLGYCEDSFVKMLTDTGGENAIERILEWQGVPKGRDLIIPGLGRMDVKRTHAEIINEQLKMNFNNAVRHNWPAKQRSDLAFVLDLVEDDDWLVDHFLQLRGAPRQERATLEAFMYAVKFSRSTHAHQAGLTC